MEIFDTLGNAAKAVLSTVAPMAATAFGGPLAGVAAQKVIQALGLSPESTKEDVEQALIGATPEQLLALKKMEQDFIKDMKALDIDVMKLHASDRASAREREVKAGDSWTPRILAGIVVGLYCSVQWFLLTGVVHTEMESFVLRSLGTLDAAVAMVLSYYFGSSAGSSQKTEQIKQLTSR